MSRLSHLVVTLVLFSAIFFPSVMSAGIDSKIDDQSAFNEQTTKKLDTVLKNQEEILKQLDEIKKELYVIKIRATQH